MRGRKKAVSGTFGSLINHMLAARVTRTRLLILLCKTLTINLLPTSHDQQTVLQTAKTKVENATGAILAGIVHATDRSASLELPDWFLGYSPRLHMLCIMSNFSTVPAGMSGLLLFLLQLGQAGLVSAKKSSHWSSNVTPSCPSPF